MMSQKNFTIRGTVLGKSGKALAGFEVTALDKDLVGSDLLGSTKTDAQGRFEILYDHAQFANVLEGGPDIYLLVKNDQGQAVHLSENAIRKNAGVVEVYHIVLDDAEAITPSLPLERKHFKEILAKNPKFFSSLNPTISTNSDAIAAGNTTYEELKCIALRRDDQVLEAVFEIKRPFGFGGPRCSEGSLEWVTFWLNYQDGSGWFQAGAPVSVQVHDLGVADEKGIWYAVQSSFTPPKPPKSCNEPTVVLLRAVLSWQTPHFDPETFPVWGNRTDAWILLKEETIIIEALPKFNAQLPKALSLKAGKSELESVIAYRDYLDNGIAAFRKAADGIDQHRSNAHAHLAKNFNYYGNFSQAKDAESLKQDFQKLPSSFWQSQIEPINLPDLIPVFPLLNDTSFEELTCLGLNPNLDLLESTIAIKRPTGYGSGICFWGSTEYVAYYINYGGGWEWVGLDTVRVYDVPDGNDKFLQKPLMFGSRFPVQDMRSRALPCNEEQVVMVRAILSYGTPPPPHFPGYTPTWGNVVDARVEIKPSLQKSAEPRITEVSDIDVASINALGLAQIDKPIYDHPFGGDLGIWGDVAVSGATHYRLQYRKLGALEWTNGMRDRSAQLPGTSFTIYRPVTGEGWFSIAQYQADKVEYSSTMLCHFASGAENGQYELRIQVGDGVTASASSVSVTVMLDNRPPQLYPFIGSKIPTLGVTVLQPCGLFLGDNHIVVWGNFEDSYLDNYSLSLVGGGIIGEVALPKYAIGATSTMPVGNPSAGQVISEFRMRDVFPAAVKCAYAIILRVTDLSVLGNAGNYAFQAGRGYNQSTVTFDWEP